MKRELYIEALHKMDNPNMFYALNHAIINGDKCIAEAINTILGGYAVLNCDMDCNKCIAMMLYTEIGQKLAQEKPKEPPKAAIQEEQNYQTTLF